jgi:hypothetical protein
MAVVSCTKCGTLTTRAGYPAWVIIVAICFFPLGLLALLAERKLTRCSNCGNVGKHDEPDSRSLNWERFRIQRTDC